MGIEIKYPLGYASLGVGLPGSSLENTGHPQCWFQGGTKYLNVVNKVILLNFHSL